MPELYRQNPQEIDLECILPTNFVIRRSHWHHLMRKYAGTHEGFTRIEVVPHGRLFLPTCGNSEAAWLHRHCNGVIWADVIPLSKMPGHLMSCMELTRKEGVNSLADLVVISDEAYAGLEHTGIS